jgi:hypothetical protein
MKLVARVRAEFDASGDPDHQLDYIVPKAIRDEDRVREWITA